jgi:hypothetical protein
MSIEQFARMLPGLPALLLALASLGLALAVQPPEAVLVGAGDR